MALAWCDGAREIDDARVAIQGFGNVSRHAAIRLQNMGACVVAVSDERGGVYNGHGLGVAELVDALDDGGDAGLEELVDGDAIDNVALLSADVDILMPAVIEDVITAKMPIPSRPR